MADLTFLTKEKLETGFGEDIVNPTSYEDILAQTGLNWTVDTHDTYVDLNGEKVLIPNTKTVVREEDGKALGIVTDKYKLVQNTEAFEFTKHLYNDKSVEFVKGGSFKGGRSTWLEGRVAEEYSVFGDKLECYIVFKNSHDGTGSVTALVVPRRVACSNFFNMPLSAVSRVWRCKHSGDPNGKIAEAQEVLLAGSKYMEALQREAEVLNGIKLSPLQVKEFIERLFPLPVVKVGEKEASEKVIENIKIRRTQLMSVYLEKDDLANFDNNAYRFLSAVTDWVDHADSKNTVNGNINRYMKVIHGHPLVDRAYDMVLKV